MEHLLVFNLATDADDPILGFTTAWIRALARQSATVRVITMRSGRIDVPKNVRVYSVGKEQGNNKMRRAFEFYRHLLRILHTERITACFSHMMPLFSVMAGPVLRARGIPLVTWYAHPQLTMMLKIAHHLSNRMVASVASAYPYHQDKLSVIGQGIDTALFAPGLTQPDEPPLVLCAGRLSPIKDHPTLISAAALLRERWGHPFEVRIVGQPLGAGAGAYVGALRRQIEDLDLKSIVHLDPPVTNLALPQWYQRCAVHVNLTPTGFGDKVAWEAMSCGRPCLVANEGFRETLGLYADRLMFLHGDPESLAERLAWLLSLKATERAAIGADVRQQVIALHSLNTLPERLNAVFANL